MHRSNRCNLPTVLQSIRAKHLLGRYRKVGSSVTRLGDLLDFEQVFKDFGNHKFAQISHILTDFCKCVKRIIFLAKSFLGNFYRHLAIFSGHIGSDAEKESGKSARVKSREVSLYG